MDDGQEKKNVQRNRERLHKCVVMDIKIIILLQILCNSYHIIIHVIINILQKTYATATINTTIPPITGVTKVIHSIKTYHIALHRCFIGLNGI